MDESAESKMIPGAILVETVNGRRIPLIALRELNHHGKHVPSSTPATAAAGDEIVIDGRHLLGEHRVAEKLGRNPRTLQRWRTKGKGPASTKIGRKVFYELNDLQEWIDRGKSR